MKSSNLTNALEREKARDQDIGLREIVLIEPHFGRGVWGNAEEAAFVSIE